jgi:hypothetical protein
MEDHDSPEGHASEWGHAGRYWMPFAARIAPHPAVASLTTPFIRSLQRMPYGPDRVERGQDNQPSAMTRKKAKDVSIVSH